MINNIDIDKYIITSNEAAVEIPEGNLGKSSKPATDCENVSGSKSKHKSSNKSPHHHVDLIGIIKKN